MIKRENITKIKIWSNFLGISLIATGALYALMGLSFFLVGAIPGVITILSGLKLIKAKEATDKFQTDSIESEPDKKAINDFMSEIGSYLQLSGIVILINACFFLFSLIAMVAIFSTILGSNNGFLNELLKTVFK